MVYNNKEVTIINAESIAKKINNLNVDSRKENETEYKDLGVSSQTNSPRNLRQKAILSSWSETIESEKKLPCINSR